MGTRRHYLGVVAGTIVGAAGCLGGDDSPSGGSVGDDPNDADGYPPPFEETPTPRTVDPATFGTVVRDGVEVPLVPVEVAHYWHRRREARFADARGESQYNRSRIYGAVWSPASGDRPDDPVDGWPESDRIVAYCGCPHHLSSIRASKLIANGYRNVFVIDEGFWEWHDRGYPMAGSEVQTPPQAHVIHGRTDPGDAGESAWVRHEPTGQFEAAPIDSDGGYRLEIRFGGLSQDATLAVETPSYRVEGSLAELTDGVITG